MNKIQLNLTGVYLKHRYSSDRYTIDLKPELYPAHKSLPLKFCSIPFSTTVGLPPEDSNFQALIKICFMNPHDLVNIVRYLFGSEAMPIRKSRLNNCIFI